MNNLVYTRQQAAKELQVSLHILDRWMYRSERPIPHLRDGRIILIPVDHLRDWANKEALVAKTQEAR